MKVSKRRDNLIEHRAMAELSRVLVDLKRDCPLPDALADLKLGAIPPLPLKGFLDEHGFRSLSAKLDLGGTPGGPPTLPRACTVRSEEHTSELQSLMRISYAVFCLKKKHTPTHNKHT